MGSLNTKHVNLIMYASKGNLQEVRKLLVAGANVNSRGRAGITALYMASQNGHVEVVKALLQDGRVDVNHRRTTDGATALFAASAMGHVEVVKALLKNEKVDFNLTRTTDGTTALDVARAKWNANDARFLEEHLRSLEEKVRHRRSPAKSAAGQQDANDPPCSTENSCPRDDAKIGCSSQPFQGEDPIEIVSTPINNQGIVHGNNENEILRLLHEVKTSVDAANAGIHNLAKGQDLSLKVLSWLTANQFNECPNFFVVTQIPDEKKDWSNPKKRIRDAATQKYNVVFLCAYSGEPGHDPL